MTDDFDHRLRQALQADAELPDDGFSLRVLAGLPAQPAPAAAWGAWVQHAHWAAISLATSGATALWPWDGAPPDPARQAAAWALFGLAAFWSLPGRWNRG